jgi:hypothetical protein
VVLLKEHLEIMEAMIAGALLKAGLATGYVSPNRAANGAAFPISPKYKSFAATFNKAYFELLADGTIILPTFPPVVPGHQAERPLARPCRGCRRQFGVFPPGSIWLRAAQRCTATSIATSKISYRWAFLRQISPLPDYRVVVCPR